MKKTKKPKILDIEDGKPDKTVFNVMIENISGEYGYEDEMLPVKVLVLSEIGQESAVEIITKEVLKADVICFDYGGFYSIFGSSKFIDWWNRFFISLIRNFPNKDWRCFNALNVYDEIEEKELKNLGVKFRW